MSIQTASPQSPSAADVARRTAEEAARRAAEAARRAAEEAARKAALEQLQRASAARPNVVQVPPRGDRFDTSVRSQGPNLTGENASTAGSSLRTENTRDGQVNCLDAVGDKLAADPSLRANSEVVFLRDTRSGPEGDTGHVIIRRGDQVWDPATGQWSPTAQFLRANPHYQVAGSASGEALHAVLSAPPGPEREAALASSGISSVLGDMLVADGHVIRDIDALVAAMPDGLSGATIELDIDVTDPHSALAVAMQERYAEVFEERTGEEWTPDAALYESTREERYNPEGWRKLLNGADLSGTTFAGDVTFVDFFGANLQGASFQGNCTTCMFTSDSRTTADLTGARFEGDVNGCWFIASNLTDVSFSGEVNRSVFEYATLDGTDFSEADSLSNCDFVGADVRQNVTLPEGIDISTSAFTATGLPGDPVVHPISLEGLFTAEELENMTSGEFRSELESRLPEGALEGMLSPEWRSYLWDQGSLDHNDMSLKSLVFDDVAGRYDHSYQRPEEGVSLASLLDHPALGPLILQGLRDMASSDVPMTLDSPYGGLASPVSGGTELRALAPEGRLSQWISQEIVVNGRSYEVQDVALDEGALALVRGQLTEANQEIFDRMAADGRVSIRQLIDAGLAHIDDVYVLGRVYEYYHSATPQAPTGPRE